MKKLYIKFSENLCYALVEIHPIFKKKKKEEEEEEEEN